MVPAVLGPKFFDVHSNEGNSIMVKAKEGVEIEMLKDEIIQQFRAVRRLEIADADDFAINQMDMLLQG